MLGKEEKRGAVGVDEVGLQRRKGKKSSVNR